MNRFLLNDIFVPLISISFSILTQTIPILPAPGRNDMTWFCPFPFIGSHGFPIHTDDFSAFLPHCCPAVPAIYTRAAGDFLDGIIPMTRCMVSWNGIPFFNSIYCLRYSSFRCAKSATCSYVSAFDKRCKKNNDQNVLYTVAYFSMLPDILNDFHPFQ